MLRVSQCRRGRGRQFQTATGSDIPMGMSARWRSLSVFWVAASTCVVAACDDGGGAEVPDAGMEIDAPSGCDPATVLPSNFRPIPSSSMGMVQVTTTAGVTSGSVDATAGGLSGAADNPYLYLNLKTGAKVAVNDLDAVDSMDWDISLKRASLRVNSGDSGKGGRKLAVVAGATLDALTAPPTSGYSTDDFTSADCMLIPLPAGEPTSAFGEWYKYDIDTHAVSPKSELYVVERPDGTHTALRIVTYYGDPQSPMRGGFYQVEWKQL